MGDTHKCSAIKIRKKKYSTKKKKNRSNVRYAIKHFQQRETYQNIKSFTMDNADFIACIVIRDIYKNGDSKSIKHNVLWIESLIKFIFFFVCLFKNLVLFIISLS